MPYVIPSKKIAMFFSPKAGGTSLRAFMFQIENGFPFPDCTIQGTPFDVNSLARNSLWKRVRHAHLEEYDRFVVVRDPVKRFLSGFSNRVGHYRELSESAAGPELERLGLQPDPDLETFVSKFKPYCKASKSVGRHFLPQQSFIGDDASYYTQVYSLENVPEMIEDMKTRTGIEGEMPRFQTGGDKIAWGDLPDATQAGILRIVEGDSAFAFHPPYKEAYGLS